MIVAVVWGGAVLVAVVLLGVVGYELFGHYRRLDAAVRAAEADLVPHARQLGAALTKATTVRTARESTPGGPGRHRADP